jgi:hypothetical protein
MSINKPFFFAPDILSEILDFDTIFFQSFEKLFEEEPLSEINDDDITRLQYKLTRYEEVIKSKIETEKITCIFTENGAYWLDEEMLDTLIKKLENSNYIINDVGNDPLWKLTSLELITYHQKNIRHIVQSVAHDSVMLENLKSFMNGDYQQSKINIDNNKKIVNRLLDNISDQDIYSEKYIDKDFSLVERCRITRTMIENECIDVDDIGYGLEELLKVEELLQSRCENIDPESNKTFLHNLINDLLTCERLQLSRMVQWETLIEALELDRCGYEGLARLARVMREGIESFVQNREKEIQECSYLSEIMHDNIETVEDIHKDGEALTDNEIEQLLKTPGIDTGTNESDSQQQQGSASSKRLGMAFRNRRK